MQPSGHAPNLLQMQFSAPSGRSDEAAVPSCGEEARAKVQALVQKRALTASNELGQLGQLSVAPASPAPTSSAPQHGCLATYMHAPTSSRSAHGVSLSPDGTLLLQYGFDAEVQLLRAKHSMPFCTLPTPAGGSTMLMAKFSSDGQHIIVAYDDGHVRIYAVRHTSAGQASDVMEVADLEVGQIVFGMACALSPDGQSLLVGKEGGRLQRWSVKDGHCVTSHAGQHASVLAAFTHTGSSVVSCSDAYEVTVMDAGSLKVVSRASFHQLHSARKPVKPGYAISSDGHWVVVHAREQTTEHNLALYNTKQPQEPPQFLTCDGTIVNVVFGPDSNKFLVIGAHSSLHIYKINDEGLPQCVVLLGAHADALQSAYLGGSMPVGACDHASTQSQSAQSEQQQSRTLVISGDSSGQAVVWDVETKQPMLRLQAQCAALLSVSLSADGTRAVTLDQDGNAYLWYLDTHGMFNVMHEHAEDLSCCAVAQDGQRMVTGSADHKLRLWRLDCNTAQRCGTCVSRKPVWEHDKQCSPVECVVVFERGDWARKGGLVASGGCNGSVLLTLLESGTVLSALNDSHDAAVTALAINYDGTKLLSAARNETLYVWRIDRDKEPLRAPRRCNSLPAVGAAATGTMTKPQGLLHFLHGLRNVQDTSAITACVLGPAGTFRRIAVSGSQDGCVTAWELPDKPDKPGKLKHAPRWMWSQVVAPGSEVTALNFSVNGANGHVIVGVADGSVTMLSLAGSTQPLGSSPWSARISKRFTLGGSAGGINSVYAILPDAQGPQVADVVAVGQCQALTWQLPVKASGSQLASQLSKPVHIAEFIAGESSFYKQALGPAQGARHTFVAHTGLTAYDPMLHVFMHDLSPLSEEAGNSFLFRRNSVLISGGVHKKHLVLYAPPHRTVQLLDDAGAHTCLDISPCGNVVISGNMRGELSVWDIRFESCIESKGQADDESVVSWMAHRRSMVACVRFSTDATRVYSGGGHEDRKIILWDWQERTALWMFDAHQAGIAAISVGAPGLAAKQKSVYSKASYEYMVSTDSHGIVICWEVANSAGGSSPKCLSVLDRSVHCCSLSRDGARLIAAYDDGQVCIGSFRPSSMSWDANKKDLGPVVDGKVVRLSFSPDGRKVMVAGDNGDLLVWGVEENYLLGAIQTQPDECVLDGSWSADSRMLLTIGRSGRARLWDAASGGELCQATVEQCLGVTGSGGFVKCALSPDATSMTGLTAKGHLVKWDVLKELHKQPHPGMVMEWLTAMSEEQARQVYMQLLRSFPLLYNAQDRYGKTLLHHAAERSNAEIIKLIIGTIPQDKASLSLISSPIPAFKAVAPVQQPFMQSSNCLHGAAAMLAGRCKVLLFGPSKQPPASAEDGDAEVLVTVGIAKSAANRGSNAYAAVATNWRLQEEQPNALALAVAAKSIDCIHLILKAVLQGKVTAGSYFAVSNAMVDIAEVYPDLCEAFLTRLPLLPLGEIAVPSHMGEGGWMMRVERSYTAYKQVWHSKMDRLRQEDRARVAKTSRLYILAQKAWERLWSRDNAQSLLVADADSRRWNSEEESAKVVMTAAVLQLPFAASVTNRSLLHSLIGSRVGVKTFGSEAVRSVIQYKWRNYAWSNVSVVAAAYLVFLAFFTAYAILISQDPGPPQLCSEFPSTAVCGVDGSGGPQSCTAKQCFAADVDNANSGADMVGLTSTSAGRGEVVLSFITLIFACYFFAIEMWQMWKLGLLRYVSVFWNWLDLASYTIAVIIPPMVLTRTQVGDGGTLYPLVAAEVILLWGKCFFYGLAVEGLGTFIYMIIEIIKGLKFFYAMLIIVYIAFGVALLNLFRMQPSGDTCACPYPGYRSFGEALMSMYQSMFQNQPAVNAWATINSTTSIIVLCLATFVCNIVLFNLIITLMSDLFARIKQSQDYVFQKNRADLIVDVDSTRYGGHHRNRKSQLKRDGNDNEAPYLLVLLPRTQDDRDQDLDEWMERAGLDTAGIDDAEPGDDHDDSGDRDAGPGGPLAGGGGGGHGGGSGGGGMGGTGSGCGGAARGSPRDPHKGQAAAGGGLLGLQAASPSSFSAPAAWHRRTGSGSFVSLQAAGLGSDDSLAIASGMVRESSGSGGRIATVPLGVAPGSFVMGPTSQTIVPAAQLAQVQRSMDALLRRLGQAQGLDLVAASPGRQSWTGPQGPLLTPQPLARGPSSSSGGLPLPSAQIQSLGGGDERSTPSRPLRSGARRAYRRADPQTSAVQAQLAQRGSPQVWGGLATDVVVQQQQQEVAAAEIALHIVDDNAML